MKKYLVYVKGIPASKIVPDRAGYGTYDTCCGPVAF